MRTLKRTCLAFLLFSLPIAGLAQMVADPTTWTYEVQKVSAQEYKLIFHVSLKEGWHIFSLNPGDEFLIPPSFTFKKDNKIKLVGKIAEQGKMKTEKMDGIDNPINYYEGRAAFVQKIQTRAKGKVTGELEYQVCNNSMCLPPKTKNFEFEIKD